MQTVSKITARLGIIFACILSFNPVSAQVNDSIRITADSSRGVQTDEPPFVDTITHGGKTYIRIGTDTILETDRKGQSHYIIKDPEKLKQWDKWQKAFQAKPHKPFSVIALPAIKFTPETSLSVGITAQAFFRPKKAPENNLSSITLGGNYTLNKQYQFFTDYEIFLKENVIWFDGEFKYQNWTEQFWGIGNTTPVSGEITLEYQQWYWDFRFIYRIKKFYIGPKVRVSRLWDASYPADSIQSVTSEVTGVHGYRTTGLGVAFVWNTRDNNLYPKTGYYVSVSNLNYPSWRTRQDFQFFNLEADYRHFFNPGGKKQIIAIRAYMNFNFGDPPFRLTSLHGGQYHGRGYYEGRYRDRHMWSGQLEWRFPIVWRLRGTLFGAIGDVGYDVGDWGFDTIKWNVGIGIRFIMNPKEQTSIRFDYGFGHTKNDKGAYFGTNEVF